MVCSFNKITTTKNGKNTCCVKRKGGSLEQSVERKNSNTDDSGLLIPVAWCSRKAEPSAVTAAVADHPFRKGIQGEGGIRAVCVIIKQEVSKLIKTKKIIRVAD